MTVPYARILRFFALLGAVVLTISANLAAADAQDAPGPPFTLTDPTGKSVSSSALKGKWMFIYFGSTPCADLCPTEPAERTDALGQIAPRPKPLHPISTTI